MTCPCDCLVQDQQSIDSQQSQDTDLLLGIGLTVIIGLSLIGDR